MPALRTGRPAGIHEAYGETFAHDIADIEDPEASLLYRWVIEDRWKLILTYDGTTGHVRYLPTDMRPQLYDLKTDPHETHNLAAEHPDLVRRLAQKLNHWWPVRKRHCVTRWTSQPIPWPGRKK